ncbi:MAG: hypothetical protein EOO15_06690 [Chitinophagaceae bacterium]|nr:MAG: hypothetical protein EOO15_06690 [Chitinophagaceae bacterium]
MKKLILAFSILTGAGLLSCTSSKKEALNGIGCNTAGTTYSGTIQPIIQNNCLSCHSASAASNLGSGNVLEGYSNLHAYVANGLLLQVVNHDAGFQAMPQGTAKLDDCTIAKLQAWVDAGAPNN